jgi:lysophospholipase-2
MVGECHSIAPSQEHTHTIIFLHGRDSIATEFQSELFESQASDDRTFQEIFPTYKWVFPASKHLRSARFGGEMSQWFDMWSVDEPEEKEELQFQGLRESVPFIIDVIMSECTFVPAERIIVAGISQGCAAAIHALFNHGIRVGGFIGLSSWLPFQTQISAICQRGNSSLDSLQEIQTLFMQSSQESRSAGHVSLVLRTPVFLSHSIDDDIVPIRNGKKLHHGLEKLGMAVTWKEYQDGGHWVNEPQGVDDIVDFLKQCEGDGP